MNGEYNGKLLSLLKANLLGGINCIRITNATELECIL
jgi:hypothetical protein